MTFEPAGTYTFSLPRKQADAEPAPFYGQYGHDIDTSGVRGAWVASGPKRADMLPDEVRALFDDPDVAEVIVKYKTADGRTSGYVMTRND